MGTPTTSPTPASSLELLPRATHSGTLRFGDIEVPCFVLSDGRDLLTASGITQIFASSNRGELERFVEAISPESWEKFAASKVRFRLPENNALADGYPGSTMVGICNLYVRAMAAGTLHPKQIPLAARASAVSTACALVGVTAIIWEATGYDKVKAANALQTKLAIALRDEAGEWQRLFRPEFFGALARLFRVQLGADGRRPMCFAAFLREFFYEWFDADVYDVLRRRNPHPVKGSNHHQFLQPSARRCFEQHQRDVLLLLRTSSTLDDFRMRFNAALRGGGLQLSFGCN